VHYLYRVHPVYTYIYKVNVCNSKYICKYLYSTDDYHIEGRNMLWLLILIINWLLYIHELRTRYKIDDQIKYIIFGLYVDASSTVTVVWSRVWGWYIGKNMTGSGRSLSEYSPEGTKENDCQTQRVHSATVNRIEPETSWIRNRDISYNKMYTFTWCDGIRNFNGLSHYNKNNFIHLIFLNIQMSRVRFPALPNFLRSRGSGTGSTQPRDYNWGATWMKK
jgi:hypothetical protein